MVIRGSLSAGPVELGKLVRLQGKTQERQPRELLMKLRREEKGTGLGGETLR